MRRKRVISDISNLSAGEPLIFNKDINLFNETKTKLQKTSEDKTTTPLNFKTIFITNSLDEEEKPRGSSLYMVSEWGTVRCSSHHDNERNSTTFTEPFMIKYLTLEEVVESVESRIGLYPFETDAKNDKEFATNQMKDHGHHGNMITEILTEDEINDDLFTPKTWVNNTSCGILWTTAVKEVMAAHQYALSHLQNGYFPSGEHLVAVEKERIEETLLNKKHHHLK